MKTFEYKTLYVSRDDYIGSFLGGFNSDELEGVFNNLGADGWEMVGVCMQDGMNAFAIAFKRETS